MRRALPAAMMLVGAAAATDPNRRFELMFRLHAPTKALLDKA